MCRVGQIIFRNRLDGAPPVIAWSQVTYTGTVPRWLAQRRMHYDAVSGQVLTYAGHPDTSGIYSNALFALNALTLVSTLIDATATSGSNSTAPDYPNSTAGAWNNGDGAVDPNFPSDRHPEFQSDIDTSRSRYVQVSGLAIGNPDEGDGLCHDDLRYFSLQSDPTDGTWTKVGSYTPPTVTQAGVLVYLSDVDLYWLHGISGNTRTSVYAPSDTLSAAQEAAGCVTAKTWAQTHNVSGEPPYSYYVNAAYDQPRGRVLLFGWDTSGGGPSTLQVWAYTVAEQAWSNLSPTNAPLQFGPATGHDYALCPVTSGRWSGEMLFVRTSHTITGDAGEAATFLYRPELNRFYVLETTGTAPDRVAMNVFVPSLGSHGGIVAHEADGQFSHGVLQ
jgi:hypothetical protein